MSLASECRDNDGPHRYFFLLFFTGGVPEGLMNLDCTCCFC